MNKTDNSSHADNEDISIANTSTPDKMSKTRTRGKKRKRLDSGSSTDLEEILPENSLEVEKNLQASAIKNNLDDASVKKILKKVVTNDHVLALVKIREKEENSRTDNKECVQPKLTRAKMKELMKVSPKTAAPWNLELTPIKEIPVKTRPEVKALIAHDLPEDEDDEEYQPSHDDLPSDDEHTLESISDVDSQPRTPATPASPAPRHDGPFKVPQLTPARKKLLMEEEEATIALRTRSKLSLSATSIEHIESSFVPPDDLPKPKDDSLWNEFLMECLNPASVSRHEEDDEADPEYNVAADPDAHDPDEEALESNIIKISRKELNDLVTELFSVLPDDTDLVSTMFADPPLVKTAWEGKQEPLSEDECRMDNMSKRDNTRFSIGKSEPADPECEVAMETQEAVTIKTGEAATMETGEAATMETGEAVTVETQPVTVTPQPVTNAPVTCTSVTLSVEELKSGVGVCEAAPPAILRQRATASRLQIRLDTPVQIKPEQIQILQQQLRQHVQLAASNFLQLYVDPSNWHFAPEYKEYLDQLNKLVEANPRSVANVCNLKPAVELVQTWQTSVSSDTPENQQMVQFLQEEAEKSRRRFKANNVYNGNFPPQFMQVVANSPVFLYPYLLPSVPYRPDSMKRSGYRMSEDHLIVLGLDQFWDYVDSNPLLFPPPRRPHPRRRWGLSAAAGLLCRHLMPWMTPRWLICHIYNVRHEADNPICKYLKSRHISPVQHKLLPFSPSLTLYEQPEHEVPRIWVRHLAKTSKRFRDHLYKRKNSGLPPLNGVIVNLGESVETPTKKPLPIDFTKPIVSHRVNVIAKTPELPTSDKFDLQIQTGTTSNVLLLDTQGTVQVVNGQVLSQPIDGTRGNDINVTDEASKDKFENSNEIVEGKAINETNQVTTGDNISSNIAPQTNTANVQPTTMTYQLVQTSTGAFLVPMTQIVVPTTKDTTTQHNTTTENILDTVQNKEENEETGTHCKCCITLKKICKKQTLITDFFKSKSDETCECKDRKYPKVSKRLRMLVNNYRSKSWCVHRELKIRRKMEGDCEIDDKEYDLDDIAAVSTYQMKLTIRTSFIRKSYLKKKVYNLFSKFDPAATDPLWLAEELYKAFEVDLADMYKEFLGFLTPSQADSIDMFKDYFIQTCFEGLMKKIEEEVRDKDLRAKILSRLQDVYTDSESTACQICTSLLSEMKDQPRLARYVFSLFPHRATVRKKIDACNPTKHPNLKKKPDKEATPLSVETQADSVNDVTESDDVIVVEDKAVTDDVTEKNDANKGTVNKDIVNNLNVDKEILNKVTESHNVADDVSRYSDANIKANKRVNHIKVNIDVKTTNATVKVGVTNDVIMNEDMDKARETDETVTDDVTMTNEVTDDVNEEREDEGELMICEDSHVNINYEDSDSDVDVKESCRQFKRRESNEETSNFNNIHIKEEHEQDGGKETTDNGEQDFDTIILLTEEEIKPEPIEWKRDEDKIILESLMQYLTRETRKNPVLKIIEENNLYKYLTETLTNKSVDDVKERVMYLLEILVMNPKSNDNNNVS